MDDMLLITMVILPSLVLGLIVVVMVKRSLKNPPDTAALTTMVETLNTSLTNIPNSVTVMQKGVQESISNSAQVFSKSVEGLSTTVQNMQTTIANSIQGFQNSITASVENLQTKLTMDVQSRLSTVSNDLTNVSKGLENLKKNLDENIASKLTTLDTSQNDVKRQVETFVALFSGSARTRGIAGESAIRMVLSTLPSSLWAEQINIPGTANRVDFGIYVPQTGSSSLILPIDSKFSMPHLPGGNMSAEEQKTYERMANAQIKDRCREVTKYVDPAKGTTNFALMFIPDTVYQLMDSDTLKEAVSRSVIPVNTPGLIAASFIMSRFNREVECARDVQQIVGAIQTATKELNEALDYIEKAKRQAASVDRNLIGAERSIENAKIQLSTHEVLEAELQQ